MTRRGIGDITMEAFAGAAETHSAVVYFAGDHAYKLKKPVRLGFLDFSTVEARAVACSRETQLADACGSARRR